MSKNKKTVAEEAKPNDRFNLLDFAAEMSKAREERSDAFLRIFGFPLGLNLWNNLYGFDIIAFDDRMKNYGLPEDGVSCHDFVNEKYGENANKLIEELIEIPTQILKKLKERPCAK